MWTYKEIQRRAHNALSFTYTQSLAACTIVYCLSMLISRFTFSMTIPIPATENPEAVLETLQKFSDAALKNLPLYFSMCALTVLSSLVNSIFLREPLLVSTNRFFLEAAAERPSLKNLFYAFRAKQYLPIVGALAMRFLFTFLWSLLFFFPGIIKYYQYYFADFLLAQNPSMGWRKALSVSRRMTDGQKLRIFGFSLLMTLWEMLGSLACGVGIFFVMPYVYASKTQLYLRLKEQAIVTGAVSLAEFNVITE